ncbi:nicotinate-nucleotide--dimethylbenzimidazole phosphoribosyltransferase [Candidatus Auribacterota bacterium]
MGKLADTIKKIEKIDYSLNEETQKRLDNLTKPPGSLGRLEDIAKQIVEITQKKNPDLKNKVIFTLAGDHGIAEEGVSAFPQEVTPQMVYNFIHGGAAINVLARHVGAKVIVADMGVKTKLDIDKQANPNFKDKKIGPGTKNMLKGPAMSKEEAIKSIEAGIELFEEEFNNNGIDIVGTGEMGIGNTTPASAITSVVTDNPVEDVTGKGTGITDKKLMFKITYIQRAIRHNDPLYKDGIDVLSKVGGFEIGGLVGVILAAAKNRVPIVVDGFISASAALLAYTLEHKVKDYLLGSHNSVEQGHKAIMNFMGIKPLFDLGLRLGEGTGAAIAMGIIEASLKILNEMATFESAGVSDKK